MNKNNPYSPPQNALIKENAVSLFSTTDFILGGQLWSNLVHWSNSRIQNLYYFIKCIEVTLLNKFIWVSSVKFYDTSSIYCIVCLPPKVKSPSITMYLTIFTFCPSSHPPFPSSNHHTVVCIYELLFVRKSL